jgi:hypothetical protein
MGFPRFAGALAASVLLAPLVALAAPSADDARVEAVYDTQCADIMHADWDALESTFSPDFTLHSGGSTYTRDEIVSSAKNLAGSVALTKCSASIDSTSETNGVIIVVMRQVVDGTHGTDAFEVSSGWRDMWSPRGSSLLETSSTELWRTVSLNGQIVQQSGAVPSASPLPTQSTPPR